MLLSTSMQAPLRDGWGAFDAMSYLDHVLLPHSARVTLALCEVGAQGKCVVEGRIGGGGSRGEAREAGAARPFVFGVVTAQLL